MSVTKAVNEAIATYQSENAPAAVRRAVRTGSGLSAAEIRQSNVQALIEDLQRLVPLF